MNAKAKKSNKKGKKALKIVLIIVVVLAAAQMVVLGWLGGLGPLSFLHKLRMSNLTGNAAEYDFSYIDPIENSAFEGKRIAVLGSSVARGEASEEYAVGEYLAARLDCTLDKEAVNGTTLTDNGENSYVQRMLGKMDADAQYALFLCQLSTNDATQKMPLGEISESTNRDDFDTATITGAMEYIISYAQETWGCPVVFFTNSRYDRGAYADMVGRVLELKEKWGIGVLDLWSGDAFNEISQKERNIYMSDFIHPTKAGYRDWWGPEMERQLLEYLGE